MGTGGEKPGTIGSTTSSPISQPTETMTTTATTTKTITQTTSVIVTSSQTISQPTATPTSIPKGEMTFELNCEKGAIAEAVNAYKKSGDYCWGWLGTHTYNWRTRLPVDKISGEVKIGPSEGGKEGKLYIEVSSDGGSFTEVWSKDVKATDIVKFAIPLNGEEIRAIRIRVSPPPLSSGWISVDYSDLNVTLKAYTGIIEHNCHEGVHLEAQEAYKATEDYCWGWLKTHTYDIGSIKKLEYAVIYVKLGPTSTPGATGGIVDIELSRDGENWEKIRGVNIVGGGPIKVIAIKGDGEEFRYIRIKASSETPGHYIDYSAIDLAVND